MKKRNIFFAFMLVCTFAIAQDSLTVDTIDHAAQQATEIIDTVVTIADVTDNQILPGIDNKVTGGAFSVIVLGIIALIRKRKKKKSQQ